MEIAAAMHKQADWASADTPVSEVAKMMQKDDIGAIPVGKDDKLIGMVSERPGASFSPTGVLTLTAEPGDAVGEDAATIEEVHEPFLIMQGFLMRTPRGRTALPAAYDKIGAPQPLSRPDSPQADLF